MAIALAANLPNVCVGAVTVAGENVNASTAYTNTLGVRSVLNRTNISVYRCADQPIANHWNSISGYYASGYTSEPQGHAYLEIVDLVKKSRLQTLILLAPLTNVATALLVEPTFLNDVEHVYVMGGNLHGKGNTLPRAEFNFFPEPEAAKVFLERAKSPVTIVPWETCLQAKVPWYTYCSVTSNGRLQEFLRNATADPYCTGVEYDRRGGVYVGDFLALLAAVLPESVSKTLVHHVDIELAGVYTRGQLVHAWAYRMLPHVKRNVTIVERLDVGVVAKYFRDTINPPERRYLPI
ncbi:hypothetical protein MRX96_035612 [Rhipicephalus microplus]